MVVSLNETLYGGNERANHLIRHMLQRDISCDVSHSFCLIHSSVVDFDECCESFRTCKLELKVLD